MIMQIHIPRIFYDQLCLFWGESLVQKYFTPLPLGLF